MRKLYLAEASYCNKADDPFLISSHYGCGTSTPLLHKMESAQRMIQKASSRTM